MRPCAVNSVLAGKASTFPGGLAADCLAGRAAGPEYFCRGFAFRKPPLEQIENLYHAGIVSRHNFYSSSRKICIFLVSMKFYHPL